MDATSTVGETSGLNGHKVSVAARDVQGLSFSLGSDPLIEGLCGDDAASIQESEPVCGLLSDRFSFSIER